MTAAVTADEVVERVWTELRERCCATKPPTDATAVVMVRRDDIAHALKSTHDAAHGGGPVVAEIAAERDRQIVKEKFTRAHDDEHDCGELARAGAAYALHGAYFEVDREKITKPPSFWPFDWAWWKPAAPRNPRRDLIRAGALIVAEIERLDRLAPPSPKSGG